VPTQKEPVIAIQHGHTPLTARTPKPGPLATIMAGCPVEGDDLPHVFPGVRPTPAAAILNDQAAVDQRDTHSPVWLLTPGPGHPIGLAIEVSMPMQPADIKPLHLV